MGVVLVLSFPLAAVPTRVGTLAGLSIAVAMTWRSSSGDEELPGKIAESWGPNYGKTVWWRPEQGGPSWAKKPWRVQTDIDVERFEKLYLELMTRP
jgi:hypothetical protein